jgi:uncharacterized protein YbbC (DUF1343 family)
MKIAHHLFICIFLFCSALSAKVTLGIDELFTPEYSHLLKNKSIGLITNHTAINRNFESTIDLLKKNGTKYQYKLVVLFGPEHGIDGTYHATSNVPNTKTNDGIVIYSLHGESKRSSPEMFKDINLLIFDIQDIGVRHYTYLSTLCAIMEEAAKQNIPVIVTDRPNPINGITVDGPMLEPTLQSFVGYIEVPVCHGMTIGELAKLFNKEKDIGCKLTVIPMQGWRRNMTFDDSGLSWVPMSPQIPEHDTPSYYASTAILGEAINNISTGIGYTLPFKIVGAPWINSKKLTRKLNKQKYPGIHFQEFNFRPFFGRYKDEVCHGIRLIITDHNIYMPVTTQFMIMGVIKSMYPKEFKKGRQNRTELSKMMFDKTCGTTKISKIINNETYITWKLKELNDKNRRAFEKTRQKYLIY